MPIVITALAQRMIPLDNFVKIRDKCHDSLERCPNMLKKIMSFKFWYHNCDSLSVCYQVFITSTD